MIVAGFDEAGYGPKLGPLLVAWTAFRVPDASAERSLWTELSGAVRSEADGPPGSLWIADSKVVRPRADGLRLLELAALSFLRASGAPPVRSGADLLAALGDDAGEIAGAPWYAGFADGRLPAHGWDGEVRAHADRLSRAAAERKIELAGAAARAVPEWELNAGIKATDSKSLALFSAFGPLLAELRNRFPDEKIAVLADKHGSRDYYGPLLGRTFPGARIRIEEQGHRGSSYKITTKKGPIWIRFEPEADGSSLPVALASMICKYVRELFMDRLNAYFKAKLPGLKPTAGYPGDAERWLRDAQPALADIPMDAFVRVR